MVLGRSLRAFGGAGLVLGLGAVSAAACGSIDTGDLFLGDTTSGSGGATASGSSNASSGTGGNVTSSASSTSTASATSSTGASSGTGGALPSCGDGKKDPGEQCDGSDLAGATCLDAGYSKPEGAACAATCQFDFSGCTTTCNGQKLENGEICDGTFLNGHTCQDLGYINPAGAACKNCQLDYNGCKPACGNDQIEPTEICDGNDLGGKTCQDFGFGDPDGLGCQANCAALDASGCMPTCNNNLLEKGEICDGAFLNGHSCTDLGFVNPAGIKCTGCVLDGSGCKATCGNNTTEPGEQCDDGNTANGDGCSSTCKLEVVTGTGTTCANAIPVVAGLGTQTLQGTTIGGGAHTGNCTSSGPDRVYVVTVQTNGFLTVSLPRAQANFDSVLYITQACSDAAANTALLCADSYDNQNGTPFSGGEVVSIRVQQGQTYYIFVDGFAAGDQGNYQLAVDISTGTDCNDPVPIPLAPGTPMLVLGSNTNTLPTVNGSCGGTPGGQIVYRITRPDNGQIDVDTDPAHTNYNTALYARTTCTNTNTEIACSNQGGNAAESISLQNLTGNVPVFVWIDGSTTGGGSASGNYGLTLTP